MRESDPSARAVRRAAIAALYLAGVVQGFAMVSFAACGAVLKGRLGLSDAQYGTIFIPQVALAAAGALGGGSLAQRLGLRALLAFGFAASALSQAALAGAEWADGSAFAFVTAGSALMGLGAGLNGAPLNAAPQLLFPARSDAAVVGMHAAMGLGLAVGPLAVSAAQAAGNWTLFPIGLLLACAAVAATAQGIHLPVAPSPPATDLAGHGPAASAAFWTLAAIALLYAFAEASFSNWAVLYLHEDKGLPLAAAAFALSTFWLSLSAGRVLATLATLRLPAEALWLSLPLLMIAAFLLLPGADTASRATGLFALAGLGCSAFFPLTVGVASRRFPLHVAWTSAALFAALAAGIGAASFLLGLLRASMPLARMYRLGAAFPAAVFVLGLVLVATRPSHLKMKSRGYGRGALLLLALAWMPGSAAGEEAPRVVDPSKAPDLVEIIRLDPTLRLDIRYATSDNFMGRQLYREARAFLRRPAAEALLRAHRALSASGYGLLVFDAYRPWSVTKRMWDETPPAKRAFVANPARGSNHNRACAVDVSLYDRATGRPVEMPSSYDEMTERASPDYPGGTAEQRANRDRLRRALEAEGFEVEPNEWWHFNHRDCRRFRVLDIPFEAIAPPPSSRDRGGDHVPPGPSA